VDPKGLNASSQGNGQAVTPWHPASRDRYSASAAVRPSARQLFAVLARRRWLIVACFLTTLAGFVLVTLLIGNKYESSFEVLVRRQRVDPIVTAEPNIARILPAGNVAEEDINSEVALITSRDLLEQVVDTCKLDAPGTAWWSPLTQMWRGTPAQRRARAVKRLESDLKVEPLRKSDLIQVSYSSRSAALSAKVLRTLADLYLAKHVAVHKSEGAYSFFAKAAEQYRQSLGDAEGRLAEFGRREGSSAPQLERDLVLQKLADLRVTGEQLRAAIGSAKDRIVTLERELASTPQRIQTQVRTSDNPQLQEQLKSTLLTLNLKRTELAGRFDSSYLPLRELDEQIAQTRAAIDAEAKRPLTDDASDQNPTYVWVSGELAKVKTELAGLEAQAAETARSEALFQSRAVGLDSNGYVQQDLARQLKTDEQNYLLYLQKREEARISDELDNKRISNVVLAETPVPAELPTRSPIVTIAIGGLICLMFSLGAGFAADFLDPTFRTRDEIEQYLDVPVLAAIPKPVVVPASSRQSVPGPAYGRRIE